MKIINAKCVLSGIAKITNDDTKKKKRHAVFIVLLHDNTPPHMALCQPTSYKIQMGNVWSWNNLARYVNNPVYSSSDFHFFQEAKKRLNKQDFNANVEFQTSVESWLKMQSRMFWEGIKKVVYRHDKCYNCDYYVV